MADYIDRREAFEIASDLRDCISVDGYWAWTERIKRLPSEDVAPVRHGTWIEDKYNDLDYVCSECGEPCADMVMRKPRDRYCKWCGARMDGD